MDVITRIVKEGSYFGNSLIIVRNTGKPYIKKNHFRESVKESLGGIISGFIIQDPKIDYEHIDVSTLAYLVEEQAQYNPDFVKVLSKKLLEILKIS